MNESENRIIPTTSDALFPREFCIDAQFQRSCLYLVFGGWLVIGTMFLVDAALGKPLDVAQRWPVLIVFGLGPIPLWLYVTTYRLRLDEWGLAQRRLWWWTLWPWESFADGEVMVDKQLFTHKARPLWDRFVVTAFLPEEGHKFLQNVLERTVPDDCLVKGRRLKLSVEKVSEVTLRLILIRKLRINGSGCELLGRGMPWSWDEVVEFRIECQKQGGNDCYHVVIKAGDGSQIRGFVNEVTLPGVSLIPSKKFHDEWVPHVQSLVPPRCWKYLRMKGELSSIEEGEFRLNQWNKQLQLMGWFDIAGWSFLPMTALMLGPKAVAAWNIPFLPVGWKLLLSVIVIFMIFKPTLLICGLTRYLRPRFQQGIDETNRQIAAFSEQQSGRGARSPVPSPHLALESTAR